MIEINKLNKRDGGDDDDDDDNDDYDYDEEEEEETDFPVHNYQ